MRIGDTVGLKLRLFQSILVPTFHYGCQIWGMHTPTDPAAKKARQQLEQKYMFYLKHICRVRRTTSNAVILAETHLSSLKSFWWQQTIQFWNSLALAPNSSVHTAVLLVIVNLWTPFLAPKTFHFHFPLPQKHWYFHTSATTSHSCHRSQSSYSRS